MSGNGSSERFNKHESEKSRNNKNLVIRHFSETLVFALASRGRERKSKLISIDLIYSNSIGN